MEKEVIIERLTDANKILRVLLAEAFALIEDEGGNENPLKVLEDRLAEVDHLVSLMVEIERSSVP